MNDDWRWAYFELVDKKTKKVVATIPIWPLLFALAIGALSSVPWIL